MLDDSHQHSVELGRKGLSETGLLVVVPGAGVEELGLGFRPKDKVGRHAPPASVRRTSSQGNGRARVRDVFCQAAIQFGLLLGSKGEFGLAFREQERGTVEQLLMTPASALEVVAAKMAPLFLLLMGMVGFVLTLARLVFHVPFRGSLLLVVTACACCVLTGIGIGMFVSTLARSASQTQLISFFVNPPLAMLSGALTPVEAMPQWVQPLTHLNPIAHFAIIARSVLVKGAGLDVVYPHLLALAAFSIVLVGISAWGFRGQLS